MPPMTQPPDLSPASPEEVTDALASVFSGASAPAMREIAAALAAEALVARLEAQGFVIMRGPGGRAHST